MLRLIKTTWLINSALIIFLVLMSLMTINWHHQMYLLYKTEKQVFENQKIINAINRQLKVEYSELLSGLDIYNKSKDSIYVTNLEGPLKYLENKWYFKSLGDNSEVEFHIDFELKNKILNLLMKKSFDIGLRKIAEAFQKRAEDKFK